MRLLITDASGHTTVTDKEMTDEQMAAEFDRLTRPTSKSGLGMLASVGPTLADTEQVKTWDEAKTVAGKLGTEDVLFTGRLVGG